MSDEERDQYVLMCGPWEGMKLRGSVLRACSECNAELALSIQGQALIEREGEENVLLMCIDCVQTKAREDAGATLMPPLPGALEAIQKETGVDISERVAQIVGMPLAELDFDQFR